MIDAFNQMGSTRHSHQHASELPLTIDMFTLQRSREVHLSLCRRESLDLLQIRLEVMRREREREREKLFLIHRLGPETTREDGFDNISFDKALCFYPSNKENESRDQKYRRFQCAGKRERERVCDLETSVRRFEG
jgi:hypothetical protein